jgi:protein-tyrosine phosphatase
MTVNVLFVCLGNICRSPTAEGVFRALVDERNLSHLIQTDSAGTAAYHVGNSPDHRSQQAALNRGINISDLRARQVQPEDFTNYDWILAADLQNYQDLKYVQQSIDNPTAQLALFLDFIDQDVQEIPDPYYGGSNGFEYVLDLCQQASESLLEKLIQEHDLLKTS